jgi:hypothetical protein
MPTHGSAFLERYAFGLVGGRNKNDTRGHPAFAPFWQNIVGVTHFKSRKLNRSNCIRLIKGIEEPGPSGEGRFSLRENSRTIYWSGFLSCRGITAPKSRLKTK